MANTKIGYTELFADATITVTNEDTGYEKEYLKNYTPSVKWQYTSIATLTISIDFGAAKQVDIAGIFGTNMASTDTTFKIGFGAVAAANTTEYNLLTVVDSDGNAVVETNVNFRYAKITMDKAAGTYTEAGKVFLGNDLEDMDKDLKRGYNEGKLSTFTTSKGRYGQINRSELRSTKEIIDGVFTGMGTVQKVLLDETIRKEKYVIIYDSETSKYYYGVLSLGTPKFITSGFYNMSLSFEEAL